MTDRRDNVPFDPRYFEKRDRQPSLREKFSHIYETELWSGTDSVSGAGASRAQTRVIESEVSRIVRDLNIGILLDAPCGDFSWMQYVDMHGAHYIGADIVTDLIASNRRIHAREDREFVVLDLTSDPIPYADLLLCRDALVHLSFADILAALANLGRSGIKYLLTTTFPDCEENVDIQSGDWRLLNLERPPFSFPPPIRLVNEGCTEGGGAFHDKSLALWRVDALGHSAASASA